MANEIYNTPATVLIPELWRPKMLEARYAKMVIGQRVLNVDGDVSAHGDILHIPIEPTVSVNDVTAATGAVTNQALTPTEVQLAVNLWKECTLDVVDMAQRQSIADLLTAFTPAFGKAIASQIDYDLASEYSNISTNSVGSSADPVSEDIIVAAIGKLLDGNVPIDEPNDISFAFHTSCWPILKKIDGYNNANLTGESVGGALKVKIPDLYGIPTFFSTRIVSAGGARQNVLFHRHAFAWGMQKNFNIEILARVRKSTPVSGDCLYGVKTVREGHGCLILSKA